MGGRVKTEIELRISCFDTMLNYWLSQKFKFLGNGEFNHLTINLIQKLHKNTKINKLQQLNSKLCTASNSKIPNLLTQNKEKTIIWPYLKINK